MKDIYRFDLHTHSDLSDGRSSLLEMLRAAESYGMEGMAFSDHTFSDEEAEKLLAAYRSSALPDSGVKLLYATETAVADPSGKPAVSRELLRKFDLVLMDCNGILFRQMQGCSDKRELAGKLCEILSRACRAPEVKIMAHPFNFGLAPLNVPLELFTDEMVGTVAGEFVKNRKIFEIMNQMYFWHTTTSFEHFHREYSRIVGIMKRAGVRFSLGSDTHSCCGIGNFLWSRRIVEEQGLTDRLFLPESMDGSHTGNRETGKPGKQEKERDRG